MMMNQPAFVEAFERRFGPEMARLDEQVLSERPADEVMECPCWPDCLEVRE